MRIKMAIAAFMLLLGAGSARADVVAKYLGVGHSGIARIWNDNLMVDVSFDEVGSPNPAGREVIVYLAIYGFGENLADRFTIIGNAHLPADVLQGSVNGQIELNVDLATQPPENVWFNHCWEDPADPWGNAPCEWLHDGIISLRWRTTDSEWWDYYQDNSTSVWTAWDGTKHVYVGSYAWGMATAEGSALGIPMVILRDMMNAEEGDRGFATLTDGRRLEITVEK